jgi:hypothetical protein
MDKREIPVVSLNVHGVFEYPPGVGRLAELRGM